MSAPFDPFQGSRAPAGDAIQALARRWGDLTRQIDDNEAYRQAELAAPPFGGDEWVDKLWAERSVIETKILAYAGPPTLAGIALRLRILAWTLNVEEGLCANRDGVRTSDLTEKEKLIAGALVDAERLIGGAA